MLVFGATPIFLLRDIGSVTIFTILRTIFTTEPALLNRLCFIGYICSVFHIIDAYSAKIDMSMPALWREFDAFCRSYVTLVRSSTFSDMVFERLWLPCQFTSLYFADTNTSFIKAKIKLILILYSILVLFTYLV